MTGFAVRMMLMILFFITQSTWAQTNGSSVLPLDNDPAPSFSLNGFISGLFTPSQTVTGSGQLPSDIQVVLLDGEDNSPLFTTELQPTPSPIPHNGTTTTDFEFGFTIPSSLLIETSLIVIAENASNDTAKPFTMTFGTIGYTTSLPTLTSQSMPAMSTAASTNASCSITSNCTSSLDVPSSTDTPTITPIFSQTTTSSSTSLPPPSPLPSKAREREEINRNAIIGGSIGGGVLVLFVLIALIWCKCRKRRAMRRTPTFHGDMMVKSPEPAGWFQPFRKQPDARPSRFIASSRNSSIDSEIANETTPTLERYSRLASSAATVQRQGSNGESTYRYSSSASSSTTEHESAWVPGRLSPRTDRQMQLEEKIRVMKAQMISLSDKLSESHDSQIGSMRAKIKRLEMLESSDWALSLTDDVPTEFIS